MQNYNKCQIFLILSVLLSESYHFNRKNGFLIGNGKRIKFTLEIAITITQRSGNGNYWLDEKFKCSKLLLLLIIAAGYWEYPLHVTNVVAFWKCPCCGNSGGILTRLILIVTPGSVVIEVAIISTPIKTL